MRKLRGAFWKKECGETTFEKGAHVENSWRPAGGESAMDCHMGLEGRGRLPQGAWDLRLSERVRGSRLRCRETQERPGKRGEKDSERNLAGFQLFFGGKNSTVTHGNRRRSMPTFGF